MKKIITIALLITLIIFNGCDRSTSNSLDNVENTNDLTWFDDNLDAYMSYSTNYDSDPESSSCYSGQITQEDQLKFLELINQIRTLHKVKPLILSNEIVQMQMQESALMINENNILNHHPDESFKCYTQDGSIGSSNANLGLGYSTLGTAIVTGWLQDAGVASLGHRRWILAPSMSATSFGHVGRGYSMKTLDYSGSDAVEFVAWPYLNYPSKLSENAQWSFSVNHGGPYTSNVSFLNATVNISQIGNISFNNLGANYGSGTTISWNAPNIEKNKWYTVTISGVENAPEDTYSYKVMITE